jgi:hypothetical protein
MLALLTPFSFIIRSIAGWLNQHQQHSSDYLMEENRVLREQIGDRRLRFTDDQRRRLASRARELSRKCLAEIATIVTLETLLAWHRLALIVQLYGQNQLHIRFARQQREALKAQSDKEAKAAETERSRQVHPGIQPQSVPVLEDLAVGTFSVSSGTPMEFRITLDTSWMMDVTVTGQLAVSGKTVASRFVSLTKATTPIGCTETIRLPSMILAGKPRVR